MIIGGYTSNGSFQALTDNTEVMLKQSENHRNQILKSFHIRAGAIYIKQYFTSWKKTSDLSILLASKTKNSNFGSN